MEFLDPKIERAVTIGLCGLIAIIIILIWPEEVEEEELIPPTVAEMMETAEKIRKTVDMKETLKSVGWKSIKVKRLKWPWER